MVVHSFCTSRKASQESLHLSDVIYTNDKCVPERVVSSIHNRLYQSFFVSLLTAEPKTKVCSWTLHYSLWEKKHDRQLIESPGSLNF